MFKQSGAKLLPYLVLAVSFYLTLCCLTYLLGNDDGGGSLRRVFDSLLLAFPFLICRRKYIVYPYLIIVNLYLLSILWYYRTYATMMPLSSYLMFDNLKGLETSIFESIYKEDVWLLLPSFCAGILYWWYTRMMKQKSHQMPINKGICFSLFLVIIVSVVVPYLPNKKPEWKQPICLFNLKQIEAFNKYGLMHYWVYQTASSLGISDESKKYVYHCMARIGKRTSLTLLDSSQNERKNLILILLESFQSWPIGLRHEGMEITPKLNRLLKQEDAIYFSKVVPQVKDGRSSDAQLLINTGLLPLATGAASFVCAANTFPSLPKALKKKGYRSVSFICDGKAFWNQGATSVAYGFDELYADLQGVEGRNRADEKLFKKGIRVLKNMQQPFYAQLVTLSSHGPYTEPILTNTPLLKGRYHRADVRNYLIALHYADSCVGDFVDKLKGEGLLDNSIVVITGDHDNMVYNNYQGREELLAEDCFVPFIVLNSSLSSKHTDKVLGQMDIYPSLLNMMGCNDYSWKGFGDTVFGDNVSNYATYRTGIGTKSQTVPDSVKRSREECWKVSDILLRMDYFK